MQLDLKQVAEWLSVISQLLSVISQLVKDVRALSKGVRGLWTAIRGVSAKAPTGDGHRPSPPYTKDSHSGRATSHHVWRVYMSRPICLSFAVTFQDRRVGPDRRAA